MANSDKNIRITSNKDTTSLPKIVFTGQNNSPITLYVLDDNTLSFEGSAGQLFSVNNVLSSGYIFGINDISGIPSFRINADGTVGIAEFTGNVGIGLTNPAFKFTVNGSAGFGASIWSSPSFSSSVSGVILNNGAITNSGQISSTGRVSIQLSDTAALAVKNAGGTSIFNVDTTNSITSVLASTGSTSATTGALVITGGVGIGQTLFTSPSYASSVSGVILNNGSITGSLAGYATTASNIRIVGSGNSNLSHTVIFSPVSSSSGSAISSDNTFFFNPFTEILSVSGLAITATTGSSNTTTGALTVNGGVGIGGSLYVASATAISGVTINSGIITGSLTGTASTATYSHQSGYAITSGFATTASNLNVANSFSNSAHTLLFSPTAIGSGVAVSSNTTLSYNPSTNILSTSGLAITATTVSNSTATGALQVAGGVGISGRLSFNQAALGTTGISTNPTIAMIGTTGDPIYMSILEDNSISFEGSQGQLFSITPNLSTGYIYSVNDITGIPLLRANANANVTANEYAGNFGIGLSNPGYKFHVIGSVGFTSNINSTSTSTGTLVVGGGVGIAGTANIGSNAFIGGNLSVTGNLTINGTTTTIESTVSTLADPIIVLGAAVGGTQPYIDDNKDRGIEFRYFSGTGKTGFFGYQDSTGKFTFIPDGTNTGEVFSGAAGTAAFGTVEATTFIGLFSGTATTSNNVAIAGAGNSNFSHRILFSPNSTTSGSAISSDNTFSFNPSTEILSVSGLAVTASTASTSSSSGAMIVSGGVGIGGTVNIGGDETVLGRLYYSQSTVGVAGTSTIPSIQFIGQDNSPITLSVLTDNSLSFEGSSGQLFSINNNLTSGTIFSVNDISGIPILRANANGTLSMGEYSGNVGVGLSIPSYKFQVNGSSGFGGTVVISSATASTSTFSGALTVAGGVGIGSSVIVGGRVGIGTVPNLSMLNILTSSAGTTGLSIVASTSQSAPLFEWWSYGGIIGLNQSGRIKPTGELNLGSQTSANLSSGTNALFSLQGRGATEGMLIKGFNTGANEVIFEVQGNTTAQLFGIYGDGGVNAPRINITNSTGSTSTTTGALIVTGGVGIGASVNIGSALTVSGTTRLNSSLFNIPPTSSIGASLLQSGYGAFGSFWTGYQVENGYLIYGRQTSGGSIVITELTGAQVGGTSNIFAEALQHFKWGRDKYVVLASTGNSVLYSTSPVGAGSSWAFASLPTSASWQRLEYGNNRFVAIATGSTAAYSLNGINWTLSTLPASIAWSDIKYGNGVFVAGAASTVAYSYDGIEWTIASNNTPGQNLTYGNGFFFANNTGNTASYSSDGINWTDVTLPSDTHRASTYGNGIFYNIGNGTNSYYSSDLLTWITGPGGSEGINAQTPWYVNNTFVFKLGDGYSKVVSGPSGTVDISPRFTGDINNVEIGGIKPAAAEFTTLAASGPVRFVSGLASTNFRNGSVVITGGVGIGGSLNTSTSFTSSISGLNILNGSLSSATSTIAATNKFQISVSDTAAFAVKNGGGTNVVNVDTTNGITTISSSTASTNSSTGALVVTGGVGIGNSAYIGGKLDVSNTINYVATNSGIANTWTRIAIPSPVTISGLTYGNGLYVGVGYSAATSTDGVTWTARSLPHNLTSVGYGNGLFVAVNYGSSLGATSTDGITWRSMALPASANWDGIAYGNGVYVISATYNNNIVAYSYNGFTWTLGSISLPGGFLVLRPVIFGGGYFLTGSNAGTYNYTSVDGINWTQRTGQNVIATNYATYGDGVWLTSGSSASLSYTKDFVNWSYGSHYGWSGQANYPAYTNGTFAIVDGASLQCTLIYKNLSTIVLSNLPGPSYATTITAGEGKFVAGAGSTVYVTDVASHTYNIFPHNSGDMNNVRIGAKFPSAAQFTNLSVNSLVSFGATVSSTSTTTGALVVSGGVGIGGSLNTSASYADSISGVILNNGTITGTLSGYATTSNNIRIVGAGNSNLSHPVLFTPSSSSSGSAISSDNTFYFNAFTEVLSVSGLAVTASTASTSSTTGALIVTGGVGVGATITVGLGISVPIITSGSSLLFKPGTDSTTAIQFTRTSSALPVVTIDTLNSRVGIGVTNPEYDLEINGEISATTKSFLIPHPTKENMKLRYGSLEGPENGVYIRGELKDSNEILLPDYWDKLIDHSTITVHLTPIGNKTIFVKEIKNNKVIVGARLFQKIHCFYSIWAERKDVPKLKVEF